MFPILTVTLNPALDLTASVGNIEPLRKLRCSACNRHAKASNQSSRAGFTFSRDRCVCFSCPVSAIADVRQIAS